MQVLQGTEDVLTSSIAGRCSNSTHNLVEAWTQLREVATSLGNKDANVVWPPQSKQRGDDESKSVGGMSLEPWPAFQDLLVSVLGEVIL